MMFRQGSAIIAKSGSTYESRMAWWKYCRMRPSGRFGGGSPNRFFMHRVTPMNRWFFILATDTNSSASPMQEVSR